MFAALLLAGCGSVETRPVVVVSVEPQAFFVERIAGDRVDVEVMIPPGGNPHTFEPSMAQMKEVSAAVAWIKIGHPDLVFEGDWHDRFVAANPDMEIVTGCQGVEFHHHDPHVWVSPRAAATLARRSGDALMRALPEHADEFTTNLEAVLEEIDRLDRELEAKLEPYRGRRFLVFHPAWGYLADRYGLIQTAIEEGEKEPSPKQLAELVELARSEQLRTVFVQPQMVEHSARVVAQDIGGEVVAIDPLARDWSENLPQVVDRLIESF
ncbi:hypothetical protein ABI59_06720 [Acidobacteria bacterium Mor1]|nr:hypothetical protein ABI59_06720 [Acidobacteria bacterium Mor1]